MKNVLARKSRQIVFALLDCLSSKNPSALEKTLNANTILLEFCEIDQCFAMLTSPEVLQRLIQICCEGELNRQNLPYALNLLSTIINEFSNTDKEISDERKVQIQQLFARFFPDMAYNCIMLLYSQQPGETSYVNQTQTEIRKIGMNRIRAMELLKTLFVTLGKMKDGKQLISCLLKTKVIDSMLYMIRTYPFSCISHQQCIVIMNALKESFDAEDIASLKKFILVELEGQAQFKFPSGKRTSGMNMGQITQIAFELRNLTQ